MSEGHAENPGASPEAAYRALTVAVKLPTAEAIPEIQFTATTNESIESIIQNISLLPLTSHLTNFDLVLPESNEPLPFTLLLGELLPEVPAQSETEADNEEKLTLQLVEKNYTQKTVREHLVKIREISGLSQFEKTDPLGAEYAAIGSGVSKFSEFELNEKLVTKSKPEGESKADAEADAEVFNFAETDKQQLAQLKQSLISDDSQVVDSTAAVDSLVPQRSDQLAPALKNLSLSGWNPVSSYNKINFGHLLYLQVQTLENENLHITASASGFYLNNSSNSRFDPTISLNNGKKIIGQKFHSLYNLLKLVSDKFSAVQEQNRALLISRNPLNFLIPSNAFLSTPWIVKNPNATASNPNTTVPDFGKTQLQFLNGGADAADLFHEWNEDYQSYIELPKHSLQDRILRERLLNKTGFEFSTLATKTAISILNNNVDALNAIEPNPKERIYLRNNIFYSFAIDSTGQYEGSGGEEAARKAVKKDLTALQRLNLLDYEKVKYTYTSVIDYAGHRIVCQTPIPGVFDQNKPLTEEDFIAPKEPAATDANGESSVEDLIPEPMNKIAYGLSDEFNKINSDPLFKTALKPIAEFFHLKEHSVWSKANAGNGAEQSVTKLTTSLDTKGIRGSDERLYVIDLFKTTPLDIWFVENYWTAEEESKSYPFRQILLRHELINEWFRKNIALEINQESAKLEAAKQEASSEGGAEDNAQPPLTIDAKKYQFNPDAFSLETPPKDKLSAEELASVEKDEEQVRQIGAFLREEVIPLFLKDVLENGKQMVPFDGEHLTEVLHKEGINLRYLGYLAQEVLKLKEQKEKTRQANLEQIKQENAERQKKLEEEKAKKEAEKKASGDNNEESKDSSEEPEQDNEEELYATNFDLNNTLSCYNAFYKVIVQEILARTTKHLLRQLTTNLPLEFVPSVISHILNLELGFDVNPAPQFALSEYLISEFIDTKKVDVSAIQALNNANEFLQILSDEASRRFRLSLQVSEIKEFVKHNAVSLLRELAVKFGFQIEAKSYAFSKDEFAKLVAAKAATISNNATTSSNNSAKSKKGKKKNANANGNAAAVSANAAAKQVRNTVFVPTDVLNLVPKIKDSVFNSTLSSEIWNTGREYIYNDLAKKAEAEAATAAATENDKEADSGAPEKKKDEKKEDGEQAKSADELDETELGVSLLHESLSLQEQVYGSIHPKIAESYSNLSTIYVELGKLEESIEFAKKAIVIYERTKGVDSHYAILALVNLAYLENLAGHHLAAVEIYWKVVRILRVKNSNVVEKVQAVEAETNGADAKQTAEKVVAESGNLLVDSVHPFYLTAITNIALIYSNLELFTDASELLAHAIRISSVYNGSEANITLMLRNQYCQHLVQDGKYKEALREFNDLYHQLRKNVGDKSRVTKEAKFWFEKLVSFTYNSNLQLKQLSKSKEFQRLQQKQKERLEQQQRHQQQLQESGAASKKKSGSKKNKKSKK